MNGNGETPSEKSSLPAGDLPKAIAPAQRALAAASITRLQQLTCVSEAELLKLHGVGPKAVRILRETLSQHGMQFAAFGGSRP